MADNERRDVGEGRLPPSSLDKYTAIDLEGLSEDEIFQLMSSALDKLPITRYPELRTLIDEKRAEHIQEARAELEKRFREQAAEYGLQLEDVFPQTGLRRRGTDTGQRIKPMYRHPETGETWAAGGWKPALSGKHGSGGKISRNTVFQTGKSDRVKF
jgi:DNA-binding protein H-NS